MDKFSFSLLRNNRLPFLYFWQLMLRRLIGIYMHCLIGNSMIVRFGSLRRIRFWCLHYFLSYIYDARQRWANRTEITPWNKLNLSKIINQLTTYTQSLAHSMWLHFNVRDWYSIFNTQSKHMLWVLTRTSQLGGSFEDPKHVSGRRIYMMWLKYAI